MGGGTFWQGLRDLVVSLFWLVVSLALGILVAAPVFVGLEALFRALGFSAANPDMAQFAAILLALLLGAVAMFCLDRGLRRWLGYSPLHVWRFLDRLP